MATTNLFEFYDIYIRNEIDGTKQINATGSGNSTVEWASQFDVRFVVKKCGW